MFFVEPYRLRLGVLQDFEQNITDKQVNKLAPVIKRKLIVYLNCCASNKKNLKY